MYYPDCGHDRCDCPSHPELKIAEIKIERDEAHASVQQLISQLEFIINDSESNDWAKVELIRVTINGFRKAEKL
jgi:hypothetical protein